MKQYDLIADWYAENRDDSAGVQEVRALCTKLSPNAHVLDVGCGTGQPLTAELIAGGCHVTALDSSAEMLARFRRDFLGVPSVHTRIDRCRLLASTYDAVLAWGVLFHLKHEEQEAAIANIARALKDGGRLLFSSGAEHESKQGDPMGGQDFEYWSFSVEEYRERLAAQGLTLESSQVDDAGNTYYLARKTG